MMKTIRIAIIDDEPAIVDNNRQLVGQQPDCRVVGTACTLALAYQLVTEERPDLVLLDIDLGNETGFDLITRLKENNEYIPQIIFVTAHNNYAIQAMKVHAFDYLLKPVDAVELNRSIQRYKSERKQEDLVQRLELLITQLNQQVRITIPTLTGIKNVNCSDIMYVQLQSTGRQYLSVYYQTDKSDNLPSSYTLNDFQEHLPENDFFQIDRATIVNLKYLSAIETKTRVCILEKDGQQVELSISRNRLKEYRDTFASF